MRQSWAFWYRTRRLEWEGEIGHLIIDQACLMDVQNHLGKTRKVCVGWVSDLLLSFAYLKMNFYVQYCQTNVHASAICNNSISLWVSRKGFQKCFCSSWPGWKHVGPALEFANFPAQKFAMMTSIAHWLRSQRQIFLKKELYRGSNLGLPGDRSLCLPLYQATDLI